MKFEEIKDAIKKSLYEFFEKEQDLIDRDVNERSISYKIAEYITPKFSNWNVDCEYNRDMENTKLLGLSLEDIKTDDLKGSTVYPDIIIHKRGTKKNLLVIEIKKSGLPYDKDIKKINAFLKSDKYSYKFGLMLIINTDDRSSKKYDWQWFP